MITANRLYCYKKNMENSTALRDTIKIKNRICANRQVQRRHAKLQFLMIFIKTKIHLHESIYCTEFRGGH